MPQLAEEDSPPVAHCTGDRLPGSYLVTGPDPWCAGVPAGNIQHSAVQHQLRHITEVPTVFNRCQLTTAIAEGDCLLLVT
jgi:hypothetical protein